MKNLMFSLLAAASVIIACSCQPKPAEPEKPDTPEKPVFTLDSFNGSFAKAISAAYDTFESTGSLPVAINVDGIRYTKGHMTAMACQLIAAIDADPEHWQDNEIEPLSCTFGDDYRWNTFDPDEIDMQHIRFMAGRMLDYAKKYGAFPNYVTFPSDDTTSPGYLPQLTMVVTKHDNLMNLRACMVVLARTIHYFVNNEGKWPEKVSSWPSSYLGKTRNCPIDDPVVLAARDAALKGLPADATARQKAEAIYTYARDEWEWEDYMNTKKGAVGTINAKGGNCCDLTHATLAMCRAAGIPARYLHGQCHYSHVIGHVIPEIYADGKWWIADPSNNNSTFGTPTWKGMETFNGRYYELEF